MAGRIAIPIHNEQGELVPTPAAGRVIRLRARGNTIADGIP